MTKDSLQASIDTFNLCIGILDTRIQHLKDARQAESVLQLNGMKDFSYVYRIDDSIAEADFLRNIIVLKSYTPNLELRKLNKETQ